MRTVPPIDCPNCHVELEEDRFCPYCGLQQPLRLSAIPMGSQVDFSDSYAPWADNEDG